MSSDDRDRTASCSYRKRRWLRRQTPRHAASGLPSPGMGSSPQEHTGPGSRQREGAVTGKERESEGGGREAARPGHQAPGSCSGFAGQADSPWEGWPLPRGGDLRASILTPNYQLGGRACVGHADNILYTPKKNTVLVSTMKFRQFSMVSFPSAPLLSEYRVVNKNLFKGGGRIEREEENAKGTPI